MAALLHELLTGSAPPATGLASEAAVSEQTVPYESLRAVLAAYLAERPDNRIEDLHHLQHVLARWYVDHVGEEAVPSATHPHAPPPLPPSVGPQRASTVPTRARKPTNRRWAVVLLGASGIVLGLGAAWTYSTARHGDAEQHNSGPPSRAPAPQGASAIDLGEVPVTGRSNERARDQRVSCVSGYLPRGALGEDADVGWFCSEVDARAGAERLKGMAEARGSAGDAGAAASRAFGLGWYWIPAYAVARTGCCTESAPLTLAPPSPGCQSALDTVRDIAHRVVSAQPSREAVDHFTRAIECEIKAGRAELFGKNVGPSSGPTAEERKAFEAMLVQLAQP